MSILVLDRVDGEVTSAYSLEESDKSGLYGKKIFSESWYAISDAADTEDDVRAQFVSLGTQHRFGYLKNIQPKEVCTVHRPDTGALGILWEVELSYDSTFSLDENENPDKVNADNPPDTRPKGRIYFEQREVAWTRDVVTGKKLVTQAGEPIIASRKVAVLILEVERYVDAPLDMTNAKAIINKSNNAEFLGWREGCAIIDDFQQEEEYINDTAGLPHLFIKQRIKIAFYDPADEGIASEGFAQEDFLHAGYMYKRAPGSIPEVYIDPKTKQPAKINLVTNTASPNFGGTKLDPNADPNYLTFNKYKKIDFGTLHLVVETR
jgi:hypothetical protein